MAPNRSTALWIRLRDVYRLCTVSALSLPLIACTLAVDRDDSNIARKVRLQCSPDVWVEAEWGETGIKTTQSTQVTKP